MQRAPRGLSLPFIVDAHGGILAFRLFDDFVDAAGADRAAAFADGETKLFVHRVPLNNTSLTVVGLKWFRHCAVRNITALAIYN